MSQNYNINMKKFNGTDYDNLLPLSYNALNSQQLDGKTFNEIQTLFSHIAIGSYIGTGTYGKNSPTTINCNFKPKQIFIYAEQKIIALDQQANYDYVSINGGKYVSNNTRNLMINTYAPELNPVNRRRALANYLCLKVDEKENKFFLGSTMASYDTYTYAKFILTYYSTDSGISLYCDQYVYSTSSGTTVKNFRSGGTQLNEQGTTYHYVALG